MFPPIVAPAPKIAALPNFFPNFLPISDPFPGFDSVGCSAIYIGGTALLYRLPGPGGGGPYWYCGCWYPLYPPAFSFLE